MALVIAAGPRSSALPALGNAWTAACFKPHFSRKAQKNFSLSAAYGAAPDVRSIALDECRKENPSIATIRRRQAPPQIATSTARADSISKRLSATNRLLLTPAELRFVGRDLYRRGNTADHLC